MSSQLKSWLLLGVIFIVGIVTGAALAIGLGPHFRHESDTPQIKRLWMADLDRRLNLTADQQAKIDPILADAKTRMLALHRDEVERGSQIIKAAHDQISALLTPEQKVELKKMESEREKMFMEHMRPWGTPREGPGGMHHHGGPGDGMKSPPPPDAPTNAVLPPQNP